RPRDGAHVLQGDARVRRRRDLASHQSRGRLPERRHDLRSDQLLHGAARHQFSRGPRDPGGRVRQFARRRGRAPARARGDRPGSAAQGGHARRGHGRDAVSRAHDRHRIRRWRIGREDDLRRLTRDDVTAFYRSYYQPSNTVLAVVGDVDPDAALAAVERKYGGLADRPVRRDRGPAEPSAPHGFRFDDLSGDVTQSQLAVGWRTPGTLHADTPRLEMTAIVLGGGRASRLYRA